MREQWKLDEDAPPQQEILQLRVREYARRRGVSLNVLIRESLLREIERNAGAATDALLAAMDPGRTR